MSVIWRHIKAYAGGPTAVLGGFFGVVSIVLPEIGFGGSKLITFLGFASILLAYFAAYQQNAALGKKLEPELKFSCGPLIPGSVEDPPGAPPIHGGNGVPTVPATYCRFLRLVVETVNETPVKDCTGELVLITRGSEPVLPPNNQRLTFQPGSPNQGPRTIHHSAPEYLDVIRMDCYNKIQIPTPGLRWDSKPTEQIFSTHADYILSVVVKSESRSYKLLLRFTWKGDWQTAELAIADRSESTSP